MSPLWCLQLCLRLTELTVEALRKQEEIRPVFRGGPVETDMTPLKGANPECAPAQLLHVIPAVCSGRGIPTVEG